MTGLSGKHEADCTEASRECFVMSAVTRESRRRAFLEHDAQRLTQRVIHRNRGGMMVNALLAPVLGQEREVEVPALDLGRALAQDLEGPGADRDRCQTRRAGQAFLGAAVGSVDADGV